MQTELNTKHKMCNSPAQSNASVKMCCHHVMYIFWESTFKDEEAISKKQVKGGNVLHNKVSEMVTNKYQFMKK